MWCLDPADRAGLGPHLFVHARHLRIRIDSSPLFALIRGVDGKVTAKFAVLSDQIWSFWFGTVAAVPALEEHHQ
jgi:hypothetical protein